MSKWMTIIFVLLFSCSFLIGLAGDFFDESDDNFMLFDRDNSQIFDGLSFWLLVVFFFLTTKPAKKLDYDDPPLPIMFESTM